MTWLEKLAREKRMTPKQVLESLIAEHRKVSVIAMVIGISEMPVYRAFRDFGVDRPKTGSFEMDGITDNLQGHCKRLGVSHSAVRVRIHRYKFTAEQAIRVQMQNDMDFKRGRFKAA